MSDEKVRAYTSYLEECFHGETNGEALFRVLADASTSDDARRKLRVLEQLERETKEFLRAALVAEGRSIHDEPKHVADGEKLGHRLSKLTWHELMNVFEPSLVRFVERFEQSEQLAPPGKQHVLQHFTAHERALLEFTKHELEGRHADSLTPVVALLRE